MHLRGRSHPTVCGCGCVGGGVRSEKEKESVGLRVMDSNCLMGAL